MKYNKEALRALDIHSVLSSLGLEPIQGGKHLACPYPHKKPHPVTTYSRTNTCKCFNCQEFGGDTIAVTEYVLGVGFKEACEWLHGTFGIPFLEGDNNVPAKPVAVPKPKKAQKPVISFDKEKPYTKVMLRDYFFKYPKMNEEQRLKFVYTYLYRSALKEPKGGLQAYYQGRGIQNHPMLKKLAYMPKKRVETLKDDLLSLFPQKDLIRFGVLKEDEKGTRFAFDYIDKGGLILVPSFDLYSDMVTGFMIRPTHPPKWMKERGIKELQLSKRDVLSPLPFGMTRETLLANKPVYITEGHIDALSIPSAEVIASPGTYGIDDTMLALLEGKEVVLVFDQDRAGQKAAYGYRTISVKEERFEYIEELEDDKHLEKLRSLSEKDEEFDTGYHKGLRKKLLDAGIETVDILSWDKSLGGDVNEVLINGNLEKIFGKEAVA